MVDMSDKALMGKLFDKVNCYGCNLEEAIIERLLSEHRTIQQSFMGVIKKVIEAYAENSVTWDLRNEASVKWAKDVVDKVDPDKYPFLLV